MTKVMTVTATMMTATTAISKTTYSIGEAPPKPNRDSRGMARKLAVLFLLRDALDALMAVCVGIEAGNGELIMYGLQAAAPVFAATGRHKYTILTSYLLHWLRGPNAKAVLRGLMESAPSCRQARWVLLQEGLAEIGLQQQPMSTQSRRDNQQVAMLDAAAHLEAAMPGID